MLRLKLFRVAAILFLTIFFPMASPLPAQDEEVPLEVTLVSFSKATGLIEFDVYSHSETPVVAWDIQIVVRNGDGGESVSTHGWDYWLAGSDSYLENGGSRREEFLLSSLVEVTELGEPPIEIIPASAVFSDGRSAGEPQLIESIFLLRAGRLSEFCRLAVVFDTASREVNSTYALRDSLRTAIDSAADAPMSPKSRTNAGPSTLEHGQDRFRAGVLTQRKASVELLGELYESLDSTPGNKFDKTIAQLHYEAAKYHRYCSEVGIHLRPPDLDIVLPMRPVPDQRGQQ